jgi:hypothetical protein
MTDAQKQLSISDLDLPPKRGRPKSGNALSNSEKQKAYRQRTKATGATAVTLSHLDLCLIGGLITATLNAEPWRIEYILKSNSGDLIALVKRLSEFREHAELKARRAAS